MASKKYTAKLIFNLKKSLSKFWSKSLFNKILGTFVLVFALVVLIIYILGQIYIISGRNTKAQLGVSFIPDYASYLGLNPKDTMDELINMHVRLFRLVSYWNDVEPTKNTYNFSELDWQFNKAEASHSKIILTVGLRQPRWPECHPPSWVNTMAPTNQWQPELESYMKQVINRYKNSPSLYEYQLENEYFLQGFGTCNNFSRDRLVSEYNLVKSLDPIHEVIIGRSNNAIGLPTGKPTPDIFSISVYKRVWDANVTHRYIEYPYPSWYYGAIAEVQKLLFNRDMIISELQAEAWPPNHQTIPYTSLVEQNKSLDATRLKDRFLFAKSTGMKQILMWGSEYWIYREKVLHDPSLVNVAKQEYR